MMDSDTESEMDEFSKNERDKRVSDYFHPIFYGSCITNN